MPGISAARYGWCSLSPVATRRRSYRSSQKAAASSAARETLYTASLWATAPGSAARAFSVSSW